MFPNRTIIAALFTIAIASSLIAAVGIVNSAFADTRKSSQYYLSLPITVGGQSANADDSSDDDGPPPAVSRNEQLDSATSEDSDWTTADNNTIPEKYMKSLSNCESTAAADGHLTLVEIMDCFYKVF